MIDLSTWVMRDGTELQHPPEKPDKWLVTTADGTIMLVSYQDALMGNSPLEPPPEEWIYAEVLENGRIGKQRTGDNAEELSGRIIRWYVHDPMWRQTVSGFDEAAQGAEPQP